MNNQTLDISVGIQQITKRLEALETERRVE